MKKRFKDKRKSKQYYYQKLLNGVFRWKSKFIYELARDSYIPVQILTFKELQDIFYNIVKEIDLPHTYSKVFCNYPESIVKPLTTNNLIKDIGNPVFENKIEDIILLKKHIKQINFLIARNAVDFIYFDTKSFFKSIVKNQYNDITKYINTFIDKYYIHFVLLERYDLDLEVVASIIYYKKEEIL
jgi:hypothetical protein